MSTQHPASSLVLALVLGAGAALGAEPTPGGAPKPEEPVPAWARRATFSALHGEASPVDRWPGFGDVTAPREVLAAELRTFRTLEPPERQLLAYQAAVTAAVETSAACPAYRRLLELVVRAANGAPEAADRASATRRGLEFLVEGGAASFTSGAAAVGRHLTRGAMASYHSAYVVLRAALAEAAEGGAAPEAEAALGAALGVVSYVSDYQRSEDPLSRSRYQLLVLVADLVAAALPGEPTLLPFLAATAVAPFDDGFCGLALLQTLRCCRAHAPSPALRALAAWLSAAPGLGSSQFRMAILRRAASVLPTLGPEVDVRRAMVQAALEFTADAWPGTPEDRYRVASLTVGELRIASPADARELDAAAADAAEAARTGRWRDATLRLREAFAAVLAGL